MNTRSSPGTSALLPCPFCGGEEVSVYDDRKNMHWVSCRTCGLEAPSETGVTRADAIAYWNLRAGPAQSPSDQYVHIDNVVYHLDDIEVDESGKCSWTDVANALTYIKLCIENVASPVTSTDHSALYDSRNPNPVTAVTSKVRGQPCIYRPREAASQCEGLQVYCTRIADAWVSGVIASRWRAEAHVYARRRAAIIAKHNIKCCPISLHHQREGDR